VFLAAPSLGGLVCSGISMEPTVRFQRTETGLLASDGHGLPMPHMACRHKWSSAETRNSISFMREHTYLNSCNSRKRYDFTKA